MNKIVTCCIVIVLALTVIGKEIDSSKNRLVVILPACAIMMMELVHMIILGTQFLFPSM